MQYILTQEEYDQLRKDRDAKLQLSKQELQKIATLGACHIPINVKYNPAPITWGCVLLDYDSPNYQDHCDDCPTVNICPSDQKSWSA